MQETLLRELKLQAVESVSGGGGGGERGGDRGSGGKTNSNANRGAAGVPRRL
jgi:hypothetical protein